MTDWRSFIRAEPMYELGAEAEAQLEEGKRPLFRALARDFWQAYLNKHNECPNLDWELIAQLVDWGWADPGAVRRRTAEVWEYMDQIADKIRFIKAKGSLTEEDKASLDEMINSPPCWVSVTSRIPTIRVEKGDKPVKHG